MLYNLWKKWRDIIILKEFKNSIKNNFYFLNHIYKFSPSYVIAECVVAFIQGVLPLVWILLPKLIIDEILYGKTFSKIIVYIFIFFFIECISNIVLHYLNETYVNINGHLYAMYFLFMINKKMIELDMKQLDDPKVHQKIALAKDIIYQGIGIDFINNFFSFLSSIILLLSVGGMVFLVDIKLFIFISLVAIFSVWLNYTLENWEIEQRDENMYLSRILNYYIEIMGDKSCSKEMKMFSFSSWIMKKYTATLKNLRERLQRLYRKSFKIHSGITILELVKNSGIYLYLAWLTYTKSITIGGFTQYFTATGEFSEGITNCISFFTNLNINGKYIQSFREFMELQSEMKIENKEMDNIPSSIESLSFQNVSFQYKNGNQMVLKNINCLFEKGKVYVIVGENGAGKTTLIHLLTRLYDPVIGEVCINGKDIKNYSIQDYRKKFSVVFQDFRYFAFTLGENIVLEQNLDEENRMKAMKCIERSGLSEKVKKLPKGIDTELDKIFHEDGVLLSGGESQKLALARALFRESEVLILDEPSSALDPFSEDELLMKFREIAKEKLVIYISHRLSCVSMADEILYIKDNEIKERGSHQELMKRNGEYAKLYKAQAKYYKGV